jgi:hypothetical protein
MQLKTFKIIFASLIINECACRKHECARGTSGSFVHRKRIGVVQNNET